MSEVKFTRHAEEMLKERKFEREFVIDVEILSGEREGKVILCLQESWRKGRVVVRGEEKPYIVVTEYYAVSDIFVFPTAYEAFSLATLEAVASGLPILATKVNGTEELIIESYNGFFY